MSGDQTLSSDQNNGSTGIDVVDGWNTCETRNVPSHQSQRFLSVANMSNQWKGFQGTYGQWTCFFCCHVRNGTIIIGFWHMFLHLTALSLIAIVMVHPELFIKKNHDVFEGEHLEVYPEGMQDVQAVNCSRSPCLLAAQATGKGKDGGHDLSLSLGNLLASNRLTTEDVHMALFITICTFFLTLLLIYGAFKGQPSHLMPFFFLQVFDFCISSMTMIGYLTYLPNIPQMIRDSPTFPLQHELLKMDKQCLTFFVLLLFILSVATKAYCINIVWRCYKYLMQRCDNRWTIRTSIGTSGPVDQESQTLVIGPDLPDYDTAMNDPEYRKKVCGLFSEPPPSYDMAMASFRIQSQILNEIQHDAAGQSNEVSDSLLTSQTTAQRHN